jgi:prolyl oligopeptidase
MRPTTWLTLALLIGCPSPEPEPEPDPEPEVAGAEAPRSWAEILADLDERAREGAVTETLHGTPVADPYRALESDSELTREWIAAQTERTEEALPIDEDMRARIGAYLSIGSIGGVMVAGGKDGRPLRILYEQREGGREQPVLTMEMVGPDGDGESPPRALIDPADAESWGERAALDWAYPSPDGRYLAFGISHNGDEKSLLHVMDLDETSDAVLPLRIPRTKWCNLAWLPDGSGFYYTRYPSEGEDGFDAEREDAYFPRIFFHAMDEEDPSDDPLVFGAERPTDFPFPQVSDDGRWLVVNVFRGWSASDVYLFDRGRRGRDNAPDPEDANAGGDRFITVTAGHESLTRAIPHDGDLYLWTNRDAPRYRIQRVDLRRAANRARWETIVPESEAVLTDWTFAGEGLALHYIDDIRSTLTLTDGDGKHARSVELPTRGAIDAISGRDGVNTLAFAFSGYLQPPSLFTVDSESAEPNARRTVPTDLDLSRYEARLERVTSADGTEVPVHVIAPKDLEPSGDARVLLYGYGGFNVNILPRFSRNALYWLEQGGVYAVAHLRGGGELGEEWHQAGMLGNKPKVFEDFEAIIGWLTESGLSSPERIAITGGSNGGLLMGAMVTRVPERFGAAASYVGLYDMVRYHHFPPAELWISEYGNPEEAEAFAWLHGYSPYHRVEAGTPYPAVLIETADHDSRVHWAHSTKFAAALQAANGGERPIYFHMDTQQGHGAGTRLSDLVEKYARMYTFLDQQLAE